MASTYISRAATGSVTSDKTFTISHWIKRASGLGTVQYFFMHENASSHAQKLGLDFTTANKIRMSWWDGSNEYNLDTKDFLEILLDGIISFLDLILHKVQHQIE